MKITQRLKTLAGVARHPVQRADAWLSEKMRCPECGHGGELTPELTREAAEGCPCTDEYCGCNVDSYTSEMRRTTDGEPAVLNVPCGQPVGCSINGGSAHCGGCRD